VFKNARIATEKKNGKKQYNNNTHTHTHEGFQINTKQFFAGRFIILRVTKDCQPRLAKANTNSKEEFFPN
jgi:hypothetical protein